MSPKYLVAAMLISLVTAPVGAQSVKSGIDAWQRADNPAAVAIWRPLAEKGDADAQFNLGQAYRLGRGVPTSLSSAKSWFERAATSGHLDAQTTLGLLLFQNGDQAAGIKWLRTAAERGEPRALLVYGTALFNGDSVTQDQILGYAYVSRAAAQGLAAAKETLAELDKLMPVAARKKGIAVARAKAKAAPPPSSTTVVKSKPVERPAKIAVTSPAPKPAPVPASPAVAGNWRIQLGAFSQRGNAEALYKRLSANPALSGRRAFYVPAGAVTRLQIGPFESRTDAAAACRAVGQACFPVPAK